VWQFSKVTRFNLAAEAGLSIEDNLNDLFLIAKAGVEHERCVQIKKSETNVLCGLLRAGANAGALRVGASAGMGVEYRNLKLNKDLNRSIAGKRPEISRILTVGSGVDLNAEVDRMGDVETEAQFQLINGSMSLDF
jgi:hypothetical protein